MSDIYNIKKQVINNSFHYHNHYHNEEHSEPHTEVLLDQSHDTTDSIAEAEIKPVKVHVLHERVTSVIPVKQRLLLALKGIKKAKLNQEQLRARINSNTEDMVTCLRGNTKLFAMRQEGLAFIWYLTKRGKRQKRKLLKSPKQQTKGTSKSNNRKMKDS